MKKLPEIVACAAAGYLCMLFFLALNEVIISHPEKMTNIFYWIGAFTALGTLLAGAIIFFSMFVVFIDESLRRKK